MFKWLKQRKNHHDYVVWTTAEAKENAVVRETREALAGEHDVMLIAHFLSTIEELTARLDDERIAWAVVSDPAQWLRHAGGGQRAVAVVHSDDLPRDDDGLTSGPARTVIVIAIEAHFLSAEDDRIRDLARQHAGDAPLRHHLSLDDPVLAQFAGEGTRRMLGSLGMTEDEPIESPMLSKSVRRAQMKCEERARQLRGETGMQSASSPEEWKRLNLADVE